MIEDRKLYPGEYNRAEPGTGDQFVQSATGCMCVLLTSTRDVLGNAPPTATEALRALIRDKLQGRTTSPDSGAVEPTGRLVSRVIGRSGGTTPGRYTVVPALTSERLERYRERQD